MKKAIAVLLSALFILMIVSPASATEMVPSIESKPAPEAVQIVTEDGTVADAVILDEEGNVVQIITPDDEYIELVLTPLAGKETAIIVEIEDMLTTAENQIAASDNVAQLTTDMITALKNYQILSTDPLVKAATVDDLIITSLFDVSLVANGVTLFEVPEGKKVRFMLQTDYRPGDLFFVLHNYEGENWEVVDTYTLDENGVLTVTVDSLSPFAIIGYQKALDDKPLPSPDNPDIPVSPQTGASSVETRYLVYGLLLSAAAVPSFCIAFRKRKTY